MASKFGGKFYAVGKKDHGIVLVFFDPNKIFTISQSEIERFAKTSKPPVTADQMFDQVARACISLAREYDEVKPVNELENKKFLDTAFKLGMSVTNTEFAISGDVDLSKHQEPASHRKSARLIHNAIHKINEIVSQTNKQQMAAVPGPEAITLSRK
jgi:hypothetical protein